MSFQPAVNQELVIETESYRIAEHPAAPGLPYGQEGRQAVVYQLLAQDAKKRALKVFKPRYRLPALVSLADKLAAYAEFPGLQVCRRTVLSARRHGDLLRQYPDLTYAVLMPWIEGPTWVQVLLEKHELAPEQSLLLARSLAEVLAGMEEHGLAHCDLSGPNILLPALEFPLAAEGDRALVALVDVEQLYGPGLTRPEVLPIGSPGYAHRSAPEGLWAANADRFAGAILLAEMLGWCDERVRNAAWDENYFDPQETQQDVARFPLLLGVLRGRWGEGVAHLFEEAWRSEVLADCATFGEWLVALPREVPSPAAAQRTKAGTEQPPLLAEASLLLARARRLEGTGESAAALVAYQQALALAPAGSALHEELQAIIAGVAKEVRGQTADIELARLFDQGLQSYQRGEWAAAQELLAEVERRRPGYTQGGQRAEALLRQLQQRGKPQRRIPGWAWVLLGVALLVTAGAVLALGIAGGWLAAAQPTSTPTLTARPLVTPSGTPTPPPTATRPTLTPRATTTPTASDTPAPMGSPISRRTGLPTSTPTWTPVLPTLRVTQTEVAPSQPPPTHTQLPPVTVARPTDTVPPEPTRPTDTVPPEPTRPTDTPPPLPTDTPPPPPSVPPPTDTPPPPPGW